MSIKIALAGNPNSGKTTLFNALTGSNQFVGNWPGVTVEKKEGRLKGHKETGIIDLPGIYSLSPYSLEEVIARNYLLDEKPAAIINVIDGTNLERNLFLTTQLLELGIPVVAAVNMMDEVKRAGDTIDLAKLSAALGCPAVAISALKGTGLTELTDLICGSLMAGTPKIAFSSPIETAIAETGAALAVPAEQRRFYAIKLLEQDKKIAEKLAFDSIPPKVTAVISRLEKEGGEDLESRFTEERYDAIGKITASCRKQGRRGAESKSDKIDRIVTNRALALPIFAAVIFLVYFISVTTVGTWVTDWTNDGLFGDGFHLFGIGTAEYEAALETAAEAMGGAAEGVVEAVEIDPSEFGIWVPGIPAALGGLLEAAGTADWLSGLILDGIVAGVGAVIGFVPQMLVLFILLAIIESCGYMARIAFILDRIFRRFGLSGKSFIPMLVGTGCGVPGVMATRTIENQTDRRLSVMITTFMPCGAKLPVIAMISGAIFGGAWWVAPSTYFIGIASVIISGIILKKTKPFTGDISPFVMELPAYRVPGVVNVLRAMWERGWSFIKKAGSIILLSAVIIWFLSSFGITEEGFGMVEDMNDGLLAGIGNAIAFIFAPLGFGTWDATVATITGLIAKENVVGTMGVLYGFAEVSEEGEEIWQSFASHFTTLSGFAFLLFNLYCPPCFAAIGAIKREMNNTKWTLFAVAYQLVWGYVLALIVFQLGSLFGGGGFNAGTVAGLAALALIAWLLVRKPGGAAALKTAAVKEAA
ncbi:MAG: ferrous iron transporter B [Spirochaetaceae bacterium]|jgi:ferrous iron transport protein B|nr:ferrous iron transporter B [Spirochaetaceae bacterium]